MEKIGDSMYSLCRRLFPICRSITGDGVRETLRIMREVMPDIKVHEVPSGTKTFDWEIPKEWNIRDAWIKNSKGEKIVDFRESNLHVMGYSKPIHKEMTTEELKTHLYTQPDQPDAIPYVTSYYKDSCGFCVTQRQYDNLPEDIYTVHIDSDLRCGSLTYGDIVIPGESDDEIFVSAYICHPSMANDNISSLSVALYLAKWINGLEKRRYTYRFVFAPETIGAIAYLSLHLDRMKKHTVAGFTLSCTGDDRTFSYIASRDGNTLADRVLKNILHFYHPQYKAYEYLERGSDERQYDAPGIDLPVCGICRSKYWEFPEYHTSFDNMDFISPDGLYGTYRLLQKCVESLENNFKYKVQCHGEPQLGKRGLYPLVSRKGQYDELTSMMNFIAYSDGKHDLIDISDIIRAPVWELLPIIDKLVKAKLIKRG